MENLMSMIEGSKSHEISAVEQIDHATMQEFSSKLAIWDFFEMSKEEYTSKSENDKKLLIIKYYNALSAGIFCFLLSGFCGFLSSSDFSLSGSGSGSGLISMITLSPVKFIIL